MQNERSGAMPPNSRDVVSVMIMNLNTLCRYLEMYHPVMEEMGQVTRNFPSLKSKRRLNRLVRCQRKIQGKIPTSKDYQEILLESYWAAQSLKKLLKEQPPGSRGG